MAFRHELAIVKLLLEQGFLVQFAVLACAAIYSYFARRFVDPDTLFVWTTLMAALIACRTAYHFWLINKGESYITENVTSVRRWLYVGILTSGLLWGSTGWYIPVGFNDAGGFMVTSFILAGLSAGGVAAYAASAGILNLFLILMLGPMSIRLAMHESLETRLLAALTTLYVVLTAISARNVRRHNLDSIHFNFENQELIQRLNDASHEIRTPISAIVGFAEVLKNQHHLTPESNRYVQILHRNSLYLQKLVDNLFLMSKANAHEVVEPIAPVTVSSFVELAVSLVLQMARKKGIDIQIDLDPRLPQRVLVYPVSIQQVLVNLLSNAVKYTEKGMVLIEARKGSGDRIIFRVIDTGIGILPESQDLVFEPFWRERRGGVNNHEGAGLGMALSSKLAKRMGGELRLVASDIGKGSIFELEVPAPEAPHENLAVAGREINCEEPGERLLGKHVLFVDDSEDLRSLYAYRLSQEGADVQLCEDGQKALAKVRQKNNLDVVIMDLNMPHLNGLDAVREMRLAGFKKPVFALSAYSSGTEEAKCLKAGFTAYINKSAPFDQVVETICRKSH